MNDESWRKYYISKKLFFCLRWEENNFVVLKLRGEHGMVTILCDEKKTFCVDRFLLCNQIIDRTGTPQASQMRLTTTGVWRHFLLLKIMEYVCWGLLRSSTLCSHGQEMLLSHWSRWPVFLMCLSQGKIIAPIFTAGLICHKQKYYLLLCSPWVNSLVKS